MSLLAVYCDESGTDAKNRVAVVGGYIGQISEWRRFEQEWTPVLRKSPYRIKMMHRADLETWHGDFTKEREHDPILSKEYRIWSYPVSVEGEEFGVTGCE